MSTPTSPSAPTDEKIPIPRDLWALLIKAMGGDTAAVARARPWLISAAPPHWDADVDDEGWAPTTPTIPPTQQEER